MGRTLSNRWNLASDKPYRGNGCSGGKKIVVSGPMADSALLDARHIRKDFGGVVAVDDFSFKVEAGQIVAIIGPNGAGKTTAFNVVTAVHAPTRGEIYFRGERVDGLRSYQLAQRGIARTFQNLQIFANMTVVENVMVGRHSRSSTGLIAGALSLPSSRVEERRIHDYAMETLDLVGLVGRANDPAASLPFGLQRTLEIARAIAAEPKLLLLDEPAAGLTGRENEDLARLILHLRDGGVSVLLVEHDMNLVMGIADWVYVLDYGRALADGPPAAVQANEKVIAAYLGSVDGQA